MPRKYIKKGMSAAGRAKMMRVRIHNSYSGHAIMMRKQALGIIHADSTTDEAKDIAASIMALTFDLAEALKTRKD